MMPGVCALHHITAVGAGGCISTVKAPSHASAHNIDTWSWYLATSDQGWQGVCDAARGCEGWIHYAVCNFKESSWFMCRIWQYQCSLHCLATRQGDIRASKACQTDTHALAAKCSGASACAASPWWLPLLWKGACQAVEAARFPAQCSTRHGNTAERHLIVTIDAPAALGTCLCQIHTEAAAAVTVTSRIQTSHQ